MSKFQKMEKLVNMFYPDDYRFMTLTELEKYKQKGIVYTSALVDIKAYPVPAQEEKQGQEHEQKQGQEQELDPNPMIRSHQLQIQTLHSE